MGTIREEIALQAIDDSCYSGRGSMGGQSAIYGGQVIGQALWAATESMLKVDSTFVLNSFHCYFISPTLYDKDILYKVQRLKEGKNFCSLTVEASQGDRITFKCMALFDKLGPAGNAFDMETKPMPIVPHPDRPDVPVDSERKHLIRGKDYVSDSVVRMLTFMDIVLCSSAEEVQAFITKSPSEARYIYWMKVLPGYSHDNHQNYHRCALAFASDLMLAGCVRKAFPKVQTSLVTSLDHSLWFHSDCDSRKWHLHVIECNYHKGGRSLNSTWIYAEDGTLVASGKQDSLCRPKL